MRFNLKNPEYNGFFMEDLKKTKDLMMKYSANDRPLISLSINPPSLLNHQTKPSHALVYIVKESLIREGDKMRGNNLFGCIDLNLYLSEYCFDVLDKNAAALHITRYIK